MSGSNFSFTSGANTGLNFSNNSNNEKKSKNKSIRMAGEVFSNQNSASNSSNGSAGNSTGSWWRNQYSSMLSGNGENAPSSSVNNSEGTKANIDYGKYDPNLGNNKNIDKNYAKNQQFIDSYEGVKDLSNMTSSGKQAQSDVQSYLAYKSAVKDNKKYDQIKATQASMAAGNDHGIAQGGYAPQSKSYYDYLDTYNGPKTQDEAMAQYNTNTAGMSGAEKQAFEKNHNAEGTGALNTYAKYKKDQEDYKAGWGGVSVAEQRGWSTK